MKVSFVLIRIHIMQQVPSGKISTILVCFSNILSSRYLSSEVRIVDKITDLPVNYSKYLTNRRPQSVQSRPPSNSSRYEQPAPQPQFSQPEPAQQYRTTTYNYPGAYTTTYRASYTNQTGNRGGFDQSNGSQSGAYSKYV